MLRRIAQKTMENTYLYKYLLSRGFSCMDIRGLV